MRRTLLAALALAAAFGTAASATPANICVTLPDGSRPCVHSPIDPR
jgi:hypothetical protein